MIPFIKVDNIYVLDHPNLIYICRPGEPTFSQIKVDNSSIKLEEYHLIINFPIDPLQSVRLCHPQCQVGQNPVTHQHYNQRSHIPPLIIKTQILNCRKIHHPTTHP